MRGAGRVGTLAMVMGIGVASATGIASADTGAGSDAGSTAQSAASSSTGAQGNGSPAGGKGDEKKTEKKKSGKVTPKKPAGQKATAAAQESTTGDDPAVSPAVDAAQAPPEPATPAEAETTPHTQSPPKSPAAAETQAPATRTAHTRTAKSPKVSVTKAAPQVAAKVKPAAIAQAQADPEPAAAVQGSVAPAAAKASLVATVAPTQATAAAVTQTRTTTPSAPPLVAAVKAVGAAVQKALTPIMAVFGLTPRAADAPAPSGGVAAAVAMLGWATRKETARQTTVVSTDVVATAQALAAVTSVPATNWVAWLTGSNSINDTMDRFGIYGTDLGIMWDNGVTGDDPSTPIVEQHQILIAFGDTFTNAAMTTGWRNNVLLRTADNVLSNGISIPNGIVDRPGIPDGAYSGSPMSLTVADYAREIIGKYPYSKATQVTIIPTGAISVPGAGVNGATRQYISIMSVKSWDSPGAWTTNYSAIAYSDDNGQNWSVVPKSSVRSAGSGRSTVGYKYGDYKFQMVNFVRPPEGSADATAGYLYAYGTPSGRNGTVYLSRVKEADILTVSKYQYWTGKSWVTNDASKAAPVLPGKTTSGLFGLFKKTTYPSAGELSVQYNTYLNKYVMLYTDGNNNVQLRTADSPTGTWSTSTTLVTSTQYPGLYAPMIHPWSGTDLLDKTDGSPEDPQYLYWNMSLWGNYNVALMKTDLSALNLVAV